MFEAFVLACLWGSPISPQTCQELRDVRGPYMTKEQCKMRVDEIVSDMPVYKPHLQPRGYRCDKSTTKTIKQRT